MYRVVEIIHEADHWIIHTAIYFCGGTIGFTIIIMAAFNLYHIVYLKRKLPLPTGMTCLQLHSACILSWTGCHLLEHICMLMLCFSPPPLIPCLSPAPPHSMLAGVLDPNASIQLQEEDLSRVKIKDKIITEKKAAVGTLGPSRVSG